MLFEDRIRMFKDVFAPKRDEKVLFLVDIPHDDLKDSDAWKARREMARNWYTTFKEMGRKAGFSVDFREYNADVGMACQSHKKR